MKRIALSVIGFAFLIAAMLEATAPKAVAGTLYSTGFENPPFILGNLTGQDGWEEFGPTTVSVENTLVQSGLQAVSVDGSVASQSGPYHSDVSLGPLIDLSAGIYIGSSASQSEWQFAGLAPGLAPFLGGINVLTNGQIQLITPGLPIVGTFPYDSWNNVDLLFNINTQTFNFSLNRMLVTANAPFAQGFVSSFGDGLFDTFGSGNDFGFLDNYSVSTVSATPEPSSLLLFGSSVLGLFVAARRKLILRTMALLTGIVTTALLGYAGPLNPLAFTSSGVLNLGSGTYTVDTGGASPVLMDSNGNVLATGSFYNQGGLPYSEGVFDPLIGVLDFNSLVIGSGATVNVQGPNPLALLSRSTMTISGTVNAYGGTGQGALGGMGTAGGANGGLGGGFAHAGWPGHGPGGGPSNGVWGLTILDFGVGGGYGGRGADNGDFCYTPGCSPRQSATYGDLHSLLLAGSGGSGSSWNILSSGVGGGGGGGALEFVGETAINFTPGSGVHVDGGPGGCCDSWGGGGGSGGGLLFAAPTIDTSNAGITARGGAYSGGGGRILFLTASGTTETIDVNLSVVGGCCNGETGTIDYGVLNSATPEPSSLALFGSGFLGIFGLLQRQRNR